MASSLQEKAKCEFEERLKTQQQFGEFEYMPMDGQPAEESSVKQRILKKEPIHALQSRTQDQTLKYSMKSGIVGGVIKRTG